MFDKNICSFAPLPLFVYLMKDNTGSFELAPCKNVTLLHSTALILIDTKLVSCKSHQIPFCVWYCCYKWSIVKQKHCKLQASLRLDVLWLWKQGLESKDQTRYAEMEEDCRQKKSNLTPAPRGREEVFNFPQFINLSFFQSRESLGLESPLHWGEGRDSGQSQNVAQLLQVNCCRLKVLTAAG